MKSNSNYLYKDNPNPSNNQNCRMSMEYRNKESLIKYNDENRDQQIIEVNIK